MTEELCFSGLSKRVAFPVTVKDEWSVADRGRGRTGVTGLGDQ